MKSKKFLRTGLAVALLASSLSLPVSAAATATDEASLQSAGIIDLNNVSENVVVSEVMTFDEMSSYMSKQENISLDEAKAILVGDYNVNSLSSSEVSPYAATYRTFASMMNVDSSYQPTLQFYCETSEWGNYMGIVKVLNTTMNRSSFGKSKQFGGTIFVHLESANKIHWVVGGDWYNNGTTTINGGVTINLGQAATINAGVSASSNHYKYYYGTGDVLLYPE
ncbi:hypothetical protein [Paenibacillus sp. Y412MC10]|uniref:hypothetical protein n=1 Tax=Geobacillus sp. (strain Y412MC10) TaxID=481743 RepID=UPI0011AA8BB0|nr:hypothetical protein [Paenibacillus sp. Y412MC10]